MGNIKAARSKYIGCRVRKAFGGIAFEGVVTEVLGAVQTSEGLHRGLIVHVK